MGFNWKQMVRSLTNYLWTPSQPRMPLPGGSWSKYAKDIKVVALPPDGSSSEDTDNRNSESRNTINSTLQNTSTYLLKARLKADDGHWNYDEVMFVPSKKEKFVNDDGEFVSERVYRNQLVTTKRRQYPKPSQADIEEKSQLTEWEFWCCLLIPPIFNCWFLHRYKFRMVEAQEELAVVKAELQAQEKELKAQKKEIRRLQKEVAKHQRINDNHHHNNDDKATESYIMVPSSS